MLAASGNAMRVAVKDLIDMAGFHDHSRIPGPRRDRGASGRRR